MFPKMSGFVTNLCIWEIRSRNLLPIIFISLMTHLSTYIICWLDILCLAKLNSLRVSLQCNNFPFWLQLKKGQKRTQLSFNYDQFRTLSMFWFVNWHVLDEEYMLTDVKILMMGYSYRQRCSFVCSFVR